ncbi:MAG: site-specific integrase [Desulfurivibrionaceae bacterium]
MGQERIKTKYPGVFFRDRKRIGGPGTERVFYAVFKKDGKLIEAFVGRQYRDNMTAAKANTIRGEYLSGKRRTPAQEREKDREKVWTLSALWAEYKSHRPKTKTLDIDDNRFKNYISPALGKKEPSALVPMDITRLRIKLLKTKSPQTVKHVIGLVKRVCNFGQNQGLCPGLSFRPQMPEVDNKVTEDLDPDQLVRLMEAIETDENKIVSAMMKMALFTGMRRGELFRLQWQHIDFHKGFLRIITPKGGKEQSIPLNDAARQLLEGLPRTSEYIFPGNNGGQRVSAQKASRRIRERAGLPKSFRPLHGLRHVFASMLASSGSVDMYVLQKLLTHKSPVMTQRYAHLRDQALRDASSLAGDIINQISITPKMKVAK